MNTVKYTLKFIADILDANVIQLDNGDHQIQKIIEDTAIKFDFDECGNLKNAFKMKADDYISPEDLPF